MLAILKILQSIFKTLHSDGTPNQVAWGIVVGAGLAFIPMLTLHWALLFVVLVMVNISFGGGMLGLAIFTPVGFLLDPLFDATGRYLLVTRGDLAPFWTQVINLPVVSYTQFNNTVTLGATVTWLLCLPLLYLGARKGIVRYRSTWGPRLEGSKFMKALKASAIYNLYSFFSAE